MSKKDLQKFGLYLKRPACELIFMTRTEHIKLHSEHPLKNTRENRSKAKSGNNNPFFGKHLSEEHKKNKSKPILQYYKDGVFIKAWIGATEAGMVLCIDQSSITKCCKGKLKSSGGFIWRYAED